MDKIELTYVSHLINFIESQLEWGKGTNWTNKDFEELSNRIFSKTGKQLSVSTLKRLWGRVKMTTKPSITSLDILSEFAGFDSWRSFKQKQIQERTEDKIIHKTSLPSRGFVLRGGIMVLGLLILMFILQRQQQQSRQVIQQEVVKRTQINPEEIEFDFEKVTMGYPNTVIFRYDVGDIFYDTLQIQQSWDKRKRIILDKPRGLTTTTYYNPGYFLTKLIVDGQIVKEKDLYIPTNGWQSYIGGNVPEIIYIDQHKILNDEVLHLNKEILEEMNQYHPSHLWLSNLSPNPQINSANFSLESSFRMPQATDKSVCKEVWMVIVGSKDVFRFEFSIPGCVGDLRFFLNMEMVSGENQDLTAFGLDFSQWNDFKVVNKNNQLTAFINNKEVFKYQLSSDIGLIGGVEMMFEGLGEIRKMQMKDDKNTIDLINKNP